MEGVGDGRIVGSSYAEHNVWSYDMGGGLKIVQDIRGVQTMHRQDIDKTKTRHTQDIEKT